MADLLDHGGDVGIAGRLGFDKPGLEPLIGAIEIDPFEEDAMEMDIGIEVDCTYFSASLSFLLSRWIRRVDRLALITGW